MILKEEDAAESTCCSLFKSSFNNAVAVKASEDCVCVCVIDFTVSIPILPEQLVD